MEAGDPGLWGSYFVKTAGILLMWGSTRGSEEVMLAPRFLGCTWNRPSLTKRTRTDQQWMAFFLCPSFCIYCVVVTIALFWLHIMLFGADCEIFWPQILWSPEAKSPNMLSWQKDFSKRKERKVRSWGKELLDIKGHLLSWNRSLRLWLRSQDCLASPILYKIPRDVWKPRLELVI